VKTTILSLHLFWLVLAKILHISKGHFSIIFAGFFSPINSETEWYQEQIDSEKQYQAALS
jgi:hypothetical protein